MSDAVHLTTSDVSPNLPPSVLKKMNAANGQIPELNIVSRCFFIKDGEEPNETIIRLRSNPDTYIIAMVKTDREPGGYAVYMEYYEIVGWKQIVLPPIIDGDVQMGAPPPSPTPVKIVYPPEPDAASAPSGVVTFVPPAGVEQPAVSPVAPKPPEF
jgi:hypothetical protein